MLKESKLLEETSPAKKKFELPENWANYLKHPGSLAVMLTVVLGATLTFSALLFLIGHILINGLMHLRLSMFEFTYTTSNLSMMPAIINTLIILAMALLIAVPLGIFAAIFLVEYTKKGNKFVVVIRMATETLSGIPSIVYGLFGMLFFVTSLGWGFSLLSGALTISIMILPLIIRTTEEALMSVPDTLREASFGLGAGKLRTVFRIVLPSAIPGILAGIILAAGRVIGETAALIFTAGTVARVPSSVMSSGRSLAIHMYNLASEGLHMNEAYATAVVLLILVVFINTLSSFVAKKLVKG